MGFFSRKRASGTLTTKAAAKDEHECCKEKGAAIDDKAPADSQTGNAAPKAPAGDCCGGKHGH